MELMETSLDKFYKYLYGVVNSAFPEEILGQISLATLNALNYLKSQLNIIHRGKLNTLASPAAGVIRI